MSSFQMMQENLEAGSELMPDRENTSHLLTQPSQHTPIRKISRNRGRQSQNANGSGEDDEADVEDGGQRHSKRPRTLVDQFR